MRRTNISIGKGLLAGIGILLGMESTFGQTLPLAKGTPGNWKKAYANIGIDTLNPILNSLSASETGVGLGSIVQWYLVRRHDERLGQMARL